MSVFGVIAGLFDGFFNKKLWSPIGGGRATTAREMVSEESALNYSAVWCATRLLCGTAAALPLPIYAGLNDEKRSKARKHPLFRLLNGSPNPELTAYNFRSVMWQWQVNWGNAYAEIVREGNDPEAPVMELWPLHPCRVTQERTADDVLFYEVRDELTREKVPVPAWKILHIPSIITYDGICGHGVIQHARESIGAGIAAEKYGAHWFGGAAVPRVVMENTPASWSPEQKDAFRKEWDELHSGADGHRIALLQGTAKVVPLSLSAEDSQFLETRQFGVEEIARWYGVPPHLLQHLLRATFNNVEELGRNFVQYSLVPWLKVWEQCIGHKLLTPDEQDEFFVEHNVDALQRGNIQSRTAAYASLINIGVMSRNEARKLENMDPVEGGDTFLVQGAMVPVDDEGRPEKPEPSAVSVTPPTMTAPQEDEEPDEPADDNAETEQALAVVVATALAEHSAVIVETLAQLPSKDAIEGIQASVTGLVEQCGSGFTSITDTVLSVHKENASLHKRTAQSVTLHGDAVKQELSRINPSATHFFAKIVENNLKRLLAKETEALTYIAGRRTTEFTTRIEEFYAKQAGHLREDLTDACDGLRTCGVTITADAFVQSWISEGRSLAIDAAGRAHSSDELKAAIQGVTESRTWSERPIRAVEGVKYATVGV